MRHKHQVLGFSLIELLLVLAIIGIVSAIAIPAFMGQRHRAHSIGDAQANVQVIRMQLETVKADSGIYGVAGTYNWIYTPPNTNAPDAATAAAFPSISVPTSRMTFQLLIPAGGLTYVLSANDPTITGSPLTYQVDQSGKVLFVWS